LQADLSGAETVGVYPGEVWAWVPGEGNFRLFNTYGIGTSRVEYMPDDRAWRFYHREALLYVDPETNDPLESWFNPFTQRNIEVLHIFNDHVSRYYQLEGGPFPFPWTYETSGDSLVFRISIFRHYDNVMSRDEYPLHSQNNKFQSGELWGMIGRLSEVMDPDVTSANCVTSWSRHSGWLPFMEMGNRPGTIIYHSHAYKLMGGIADLPENIRTYFEKTAPEYLEAPREWTSPEQRIGTWDYSKHVIDERRDAGLKEGETPFSWPKS